LAQKSDSVPIFELGVFADAKIFGMAQRAVPVYTAIRGGKMRPNLKHAR
jgi:hypothetical protein